MSDLLQLYQEIILRHNKTPLNYGRPDQWDHSATGKNPLCGDQVTVYWNLKDDCLSDVRFEAQGCAISRASASMMTDVLSGKTKNQANELFQLLKKNLTEGEIGGALEGHMGDLFALSGVRNYPSRIKCATLAWEALLEG